MQILVILHYVVSAEYDQIVVIEDLSCIGIDCVDPLVALVGCALEEAVHGLQTPLPAPVALAADLLQAEDICVQAHELGAEDRYSVLQAGQPVLPVVQAHEIECGDAKPDGHALSIISI
jgi:hypothetical protein